MAAPSPPPVPLRIWSSTQVPLKPQKVSLDLVDDALRLLQSLLLAVGPELGVVREEFEVLVVLDLIGVSTPS